MAEGHNAAPKRFFSGARSWFARHEQTLLIINSVNIALLFLLYLFGMYVPLSIPAIMGLVNIVAIVLVSFIFVSTIWKGLVPAVICLLGVVLLHNAIILPYFFLSGTSTVSDFTFKSQDLTNNPVRASAQVAPTMHFFLGLGMVALAITLAYRPGFLFTRNRPQQNEKNDEWSRYPIWYDNIKLVGDHREQMAPAKSLMQERDRYLIWRYEYVLAYIYGRAHLVRPEGLVPRNNTTFVRDRKSGLLIGKARYTGYFT
jgi:hypothetical protein